MRGFTLVTLCVIAVAVVSAAPDGEKFTTKYDNIDLDEILNNDRLRDSYYKCLIGEGKCTPDGEELKKDIPRALKEKCAGCSETQKEGTRKVFHYLIEHKPDQFKKLEEIYDPEGIYRRENQDLIEKEGLKLP